MILSAGMMLHMSSCRLIQNGSRLIHAKWLLLKSVCNCELQSHSGAGF